MSLLHALGELLKLHGEHHVATNLELTREEKLLAVGLAGHKGLEVRLRGVDDACGNKRAVSNNFLPGELICRLKIRKGVTVSITNTGGTGRSNGMLKFDTHDEGENRKVADLGTVTSEKFTARVFIRRHAIVTGFIVLGSAINDHRPGKCIGIACRTANQKRKWKVELQIRTIRSTSALGDLTIAILQVNDIGDLVSTDINVELVNTVDTLDDGGVGLEASLELSEDILNRHV